MITPMSCAQTTRFTWTVPLSLSTGHLGDGGDVGVGVNAARHTEAALARPLGGRPAEFVGGGLEHTDHARVAQIVQAELHRINARAGSHDFNLRFAGKGVGVVAGRAPCAGGKRMRVNEPPKPPPRDAVRWFGTV